MRIKAHTLFIFSFMIPPLLGAPIGGLALTPQYGPVVQMFAGNKAASIPPSYQMRLPLSPSLASVQTSIGDKATSTSSRFGLPPAAPHRCAFSASRPSPAACLADPNSYSNQDHILFTHHPNDVLKASTLKLGKPAVPSEGDVYHIDGHHLPLDDDPSQLAAKKLKDPKELEHLDRLNVLRYHGQETVDPKSPTWAITTKPPGENVWGIVDWNTATLGHVLDVEKEAWRLVGEARLDYAKRYGLIHQVIPSTRFTHVTFERRGNIPIKAHLFDWSDATKVPPHLKGPDGTYHFTPQQEEMIRKNASADQLGL